MKPLVSNVRFIVQPLPNASNVFLNEEERFHERYVNSVVNSVIFSASLSF